MDHPETGKPTPWDAVVEAKSITRSIDAVPDGIFLEDRKILLPWGARFIHIHQYAQSNRMVRTIAWSEIYWNQPVLFGIQTQLLQIILFPFGWLDSATAWLDRGTDEYAVSQSYLRSQAHLVRLLGQPIRSQNDACPNVKSFIQWKHGEVSINLLQHGTNNSMNLVHHCILHISKNRCCGMPASPEEKRAGWNEEPD